MHSISLILVRMSFMFIFVISALGISSCGVKGPPLPPFSATAKKSDWENTLEKIPPSPRPSSSPSPASF